MIESMVRLAGIEPATLGLEGRCSILLSYRRVKHSRYTSRRKPWPGIVPKHRRPEPAARPPPEGPARDDCIAEPFASVRQPPSTWDCPRVHPGHHEPACEGVPVALPCVPVEAARVLASRYEGLPGPLHSCWKEFVGLDVGVLEHALRWIVGTGTLAREVHEHMSTERTMEFIGTVREYPLLDR
jgi:hypothetical protein